MTRASPAWHLALLAAAVAHAQPVVLGPELSFGLPVLAAPTAYQYSPQAGFDGTQYWVSWESFDRVRVCETVGARVTLDGGVLDPSLTLLPWDGARCNTPHDFAFDGTNTIWAGDSFGDGPEEFSFARLAGDGGSLDATMRSSWTGVYPRMAMGPGELLAVSSDGTSLRSWRRFSDGGVVPANGTLIVANTGLAPSFTETSVRSDLAWEGTRYLAVWMDVRTDTGDILGVWLDATGTPSSAQFVIAAGTGKQSAPRVEVAPGSPTALVIWQDETTPFMSRIRGAVVTFTSGVGAPFDIAVSATTDSVKPALAFSGGDFIAVWLNWITELRATRISTTGTVRDPGGVLVDDGDEDADNGRLTIVAGPTGQSLVVWLSSSLTTVGKRLQGATPIEALPFPLHLAAPAQMNPSLATAPAGQTLMAWVDVATHSQSKLSYAFLTADGGSTAPQTLVTARLEEAVHVAVNGATWWVSLIDDGTAWGALITSTGASTPVQLTSAPLQTLSTSTARDGTGFLTVWADSRAGASQLWARRSFPDGGLGPELQLTSGGTAKDAIALATNASGVALVVWGTDNSNSVDGIRFTGSTVLDTSPLHFGGNQYFSRPAVVSDGTDFLVLWEESGNGTDVRGRFLGAAGAPGPVFSVAATAANEDHAAATWDGRDFLVSYETNDDVFVDVYGSQVARDGGIKPRLRIATALKETEFMPAASALGVGKWWLAFGRFDPSPAVGAPRVHAQLFSDGTLGTGCATGSECLTGFCVDGVCCENSCPGGPGDCQACGPAGLCRPLIATTVCRPAVDLCDLPELCDGVATVCPGDFFVDAGLCLDGGAITDGGTMTDGGAMPDGGATPDGGPMPDGGTIDGGTMPDGGTIDGGTMPDGGTMADGGNVADGGGSTRTLGVGCGCTAAPSPWLTWGLVVLALRRRSNRRGESVPTVRLEGSRDEWTRRPSTPLAGLAEIRLSIRSPRAESRGTSSASSQGDRVLSTCDARDAATRSPSTPLGTNGLFRSTLTG